MSFPSVNKLSMPLLDALINDADALRLEVSQLSNGTTVVDAGIKACGGLEAGRRIAELCLGGLGKLQLLACNGLDNWLWHINVHTSHPVIACLASQYAGWSLSHGKGKHNFNALGSGPARAMGSREVLFKELNYREPAGRTCLVIEADRMPPVDLADKIADQCGIAADELSLIMTPTCSLSGTVQVVARVLELALHKVHALGFDLAKVIDGTGSAPICPPAKDFVTAMSRTNDAIMFAGQVHLFVQSEDKEAEILARQLPSSASSDYGRLFGKIFKDVKYDFYKIDPMLFSPAKVTVTALQSGRTFHAGAIDETLLNESFSSSCA